MKNRGILTGTGVFALVPGWALLIVACGSASSALPDAGALSGDETGSSGTTPGSPDSATTATSGTSTGSPSGDTSGSPSGSPSGSGTSSGLSSSGSSGSTSSSGAASGSSSGGTLDAGGDAGVVGDAGATCGTAGHGPLFADTPTQKATSFADGTISPFTICTTESPNFGRNTILNGDPSIEFFWTQVGYNGTRLRRGAEACSSLNFLKEGWYGFRFYLPTPGFPTDKSEGIGQIFAHGGCSSWAAMLHVTNNSLALSYRPACVAPREAPLAADIRRNTWNPIIIHFVASHQKAGTIEVWYGDAVCRGGAPTYRQTGIDFGFGTWIGDTFVNMPNNGIGLKFGMYNFDDGNYTAGETRTIHYDNVSQLDGNPPNAYAIVNPVQ